jgi:hypothetical protein
MSGGGRRAVLGVCLLAASYAGMLPAATWREDFASASLDPTRWQRTLDGDFRTQSAEVVASGTGYRLRLQADTVGTRDDTVKHLGVASRCALPIGSDARIRVRFDWGPPDNGSYLAAALVISPHATTGDPQTTDDWLSIAYVGVPPGRNARLLIIARRSGATRTLYADGWPDHNREGRPIESAEIEVAWRGPSLEVREDERLVLTVAASEAPFADARVYLQLSSHSNYRAREVHFGDLRWTVGDDRPLNPMPSAPACAARPPA